MEQKQNPLEALKAVLANQDPRSAQLKPYLQLVDALNQELERTHATIQAKISNREVHYDDDKALTDLRTSYAHAIGNYQEALDKLNAKIEIRDFKQGDKNDAPSPL